MNRYMTPKVNSFSISFEHAYTNITWGGNDATAAGEIGNSKFRCRSFISGTISKSYIEVNISNTIDPMYNTIIEFFSIHYDR